MINRLIKVFVCIFDYVVSQDVDNCPLGNKRKQCKRNGFNSFRENLLKNNKVEQYYYYQ